MGMRMTGVESTAKVFFLGADCCTDSCAILWFISLTTVVTTDVAVLPVVEAAAVREMKLAISRVDGFLTGKEAFGLLPVLLH